MNKHSPKPQLDIDDDPDLQPESLRDKLTNAKRVFDNGDRERRGSLRVFVEGAPIEIKRDISREKMDRRHDEEVRRSREAEMYAERLERERAKSREKESLLSEIFSTKINEERLCYPNVCNALEHVPEIMNKPPVLRSDSLQEVKFNPLNPHKHMPMGGLGDETPAKGDAIDECVPEKHWPTTRTYPLLRTNNHGHLAQTTTDFQTRESNSDISIAK